MSAKYRYMDSASHAILEFTYEKVGEQRTKWKHFFVSLLRSIYVKKHKY